MSGSSIIYRSIVRLYSSKSSSSIPVSLFPHKLQANASLPINSHYVLGSRPSRLFLSSASAAKDEAAGKNDPKETQTDKDASSSETSLEKQLKQELTKVNNDLSILRSKCEDFEDKYKRSLADSENLRTRLTKQIQDQKMYAIQAFCKDLTDIEDILHLAIESVPKEQVHENKNLATLYEGLKMTEARLLQVFKHHGLTQLNPINTKFNPNEHEAVLQKEEPGKESGTVILVSKLGYKLYERVIRPAVVGVAK